MDGFGGRVGLHSESGKDGSSRIELDALEEHLNPSGTVHGGVLATLVDSAMGLAARSTTDDGGVPATSQLTVTYLRPGRTGPMVATAQVRKQGEHLLVCDAEVEQEGKTLVYALATFAVIRH